MRSTCRMPRISLTFLSRQSQSGKSRRKGGKKGPEASEWDRGGKRWIGVGMGYIDIPSNGQFTLWIPLVI